MPSSRPNIIPTVIHLVQQIKPRSILDVGVGFGKWGHLFREYTDIREAERDPKRYQRTHWRVRIDGIEGHAAYLTPMHRFLYDNVHVGDARSLVKRLPSYDLIFLGDVIEHLTKRDGMRLLSDCLRRAEKAVVVSTPKYETNQEALCGNKLEQHRSLWTEQDFHSFPGARVKTIDRATLLAVLAKRGGPPLKCTPPQPTRPADADRIRRCSDALCRRIPIDSRFILVDEDQLRFELPHKRAIPFTEKNGQYWGPPSDDAAAIREFQRLLKRRPEYVAVTWPCFWWVQYYPAFARRVRERFRCVLKNDSVTIFASRSAPGHRTESGA